MSDATRLILILTGVIAGAVAGMMLAFLFSPLWAVALIMPGLMWFGWHMSHRPWHGKRNSKSFKSWRKTFYGPPLTQAGRDGLIGAAIGLPTGLYFFGRIVWSA